MLSKKRTKDSRARGSNSHGWGHKKKHRGKGHRGGVGLSGTGARGDAQKPGILSSSRRTLRRIAAVKGVKISSIVAGARYFGKYGFKSRNIENIKTISLAYIESSFEVMKERGSIREENKELVLDLSALGYDKLLGRGKFTKKLTIKVDTASEMAIQSVEKAGGKVILSTPKSSE